MYKAAIARIKRVCPNLSAFEFFQHETWTWLSNPNGLNINILMKKMSPDISDIDIVN